MTARARVSSAADSAAGSAARSAVSAAERVHSLRAKMESVEGRRMQTPVLSVPPALAALLPGGGLRVGSAYSLAPSGSLLLSLLARSTQTGSWCAVVGMPHLGMEAAEHLGVDLSRLVLIPDPGSRWLAVVATLADVLPIVAVRPPASVSEADAARLAARMREKNSVLLVQGFWPHPEASLEVSAPRWSGLEDGHGLLSERALTVTVHSRRLPVARRARVMLPDAQGALHGALHGALSSARDGASSGATGSRAAEGLTDGVHDGREEGTTKQARGRVPHELSLRPLMRAVS